MKLYAHPFSSYCQDCPNVHAYRRRLLERSSFKRAVDEARPFRSFFPLGARGRD